MVLEMYRILKQHCQIFLLQIGHCCLHIQVQLNILITENTSIYLLDLLLFLWLDSIPYYASQMQALLSLRFIKKKSEWKYKTLCGNIRCYIEFKNRHKSPKRNFLIVPHSAWFVSNLPIQIRNWIRTTFEYFCYLMMPCLDHLNIWESHRHLVLENLQELIQL